MLNSSRNGRDNSRRRRHPADGPDFEIRDTISGEEAKEKPETTGRKKQMILM
jgi:hypothetical protein